MLSLPEMSAAMADNDTFVVHQDWLDSIVGLPIEQQDKIIAEFVRYGTEMELQHSDDPVVQAFVNMLKGRIDASKEAYQKKVEMSKGAGRKKKADSGEIYRLAREGYTSAEIANTLGMSKSSVDHSEGWKNRKNDQFEF